MWENWFGGAGTAAIDTTSVSGLGADSFSTGAFSGSGLTDSFDFSGFGNDSFSQGAFSGDDFLNSSSIGDSSSTDFLNSFGDQSKSIFGGLESIAGSDAFKNLSSLGLGAANYVNAKKRADKSGKIEDEQLSDYREDRAYNKSRRDRTSALRF